MSNKSFYEPGQIVTDISGNHYRVASKIASPAGTLFRFTDTQGKLATDVIPVTPTFARFASSMRFHLAYNKDFDLYIRAYCEQLGLPIPLGRDNKPMQWAKWLERYIAPKLYVNHATSVGGDNVEAMKDEAIHEMLFTELGHRNVLGKFHEIMKRYPKEVRKQSVGQQITDYLINVFRWRIEEMNRKIKEQMGEKQYATDVPCDKCEGEGRIGDRKCSKCKGKGTIKGEGTFSQVPLVQDVDDEGEEFNILETEEHSKSLGEFQSTESAHDISKFREGFYGWLKTHQSERSAKWFITLFDIYWQWVSESSENESSEGRPAYMPARRELEPLWAETTQLSNASLYEYIGRLATMLERYIQENRHDLGEGNIFVKLIDGIHQQRENIRKKQKSKQPMPAHASLAALNLASEEYHPSEKTEVLSEPLQDLGPEWREGEKSYELARNKAIIRDARATPEEKAVAKSRIEEIHVFATRKNAKLVRGDQLTPEMLQQVQNAFPYRWTSENPHRTARPCDACDINEPFVGGSAEGHNHPTIPLQTDDQWIREHSFHFTNDGRLMARRNAEPVYLAGEPESLSAMASLKLAEFGENVLPPEPPEGYGEEEELEGLRMNREHSYCPRCLECTTCNLRPCDKSPDGEHLPGVSEEEKWPAYKAYHNSLRQKQSAVGNSAEHDLSEAAVNILQARADQMLTPDDWDLLNRGLRYAQRSPLAPAVKKLLEAHDLQMLTEDEWEGLAQAVATVTGRNISWRNPDELSDSDWEAQHGEKQSSEPLQQLRPDITPGDTGRLPHARKEGAEGNWEAELEQALLLLDRVTESGPTEDIRECSRMSAADLRQFQQEAKGPKIGAGPVTPQQMMTRNVQQSQGVSPEEQQQNQPQQPPPGDGAAVAIMPESGSGEDQPMKHTVPPELMNAKYHMGADEFITDPEERSRAYAEANTALRTEDDSPQVGADVENLIAGLDHDAATPVFEHGQWWVTCGACGAIWSVVDTNNGLELEEMEPGDETCPSGGIGLPENTIGDKMSSLEESVLVDRKKFFDSVRKHASTGLECEFIEYKPGQWYYFLENWDSPKGAWDWHEYATVYGPFGSEEQAIEHLQNNHANPGGWSSNPYQAGREKDPALAKMISEARSGRERS